MSQLELGFSALKVLGIDKALIVHARWGIKLLNGSKPWEMRSSKTLIRGRVGIIFSGSGLIYGAANLIDSLDPLTPDEFIESFHNHQIPDEDSGMKIKYRFPWVFDSQEIFDKPIAYKHPKGAVKWVNLLKLQN